MGIAKLSTAAPAETDLHQQALDAYAQKLIGYAEMASDVCHSINNHLADLSMSAELMEMTLETGEKEKAAECAVHIGKKVFQMAGFVKGLAILGRSSLTKDPYKFVLKPTIDYVLELYRGKLNGVNMVSDTTGVDPKISIVGFEGRLGHAFRNILVNAIDAQKECGSADETQLIVKTEDRGSHWAITITHNGPLITADIRNKIFDPFFSTKDPAKNKGIGLTVARAFIEQHGGELTLLPPKDKWTTFEMTIRKT